MKKILIIDDEKEICRMVKMVLESTGNYQVEMAYTGKSGLKLSRIIKPDLILLDIRMPGLDGFEVLKRLKSKPQTMSIPVVILSVCSDDESKIRGASLYDDCYLTKPFDQEDLLDRIAVVFRRRENHSTTSRRD